MTRIVVFAYSLIGHSCLRALIGINENIVGVFTHPDASGENLWFPSVAELAKEYGIPIVATEGPKDPAVFSALQKMQPDLLFSFYYRKMIPGVILDIPSLGCFNMHGSLLPRYRGRAPINWAIVHGDKETGATLHHMVKSADAGAIVDQEAVSIEPTETAFDLTHKVGKVAVHILQRQLPALKAGKAPAIPQDDTKATYFGGRSAKDSQINWHQTAWQIHNLIRAVPYPYFPPAFTHLEGEKLEIWANHLPNKDVRLDTPAQPGQVVAVDSNQVRIACGNSLEFLDITAASLPLSGLKVGIILGNS